MIPRKDTMPVQFGFTASILSNLLDLKRLNVYRCLSSRGWKIYASENVDIILLEFSMWSIDKCI